MPSDDDPPTNLELVLLRDGSVASWFSVHKVFCPVHDRELDVTGCLACKAAVTNL